MFLLLSFILPPTPPASNYSDSTLATTRNLTEESIANLLEHDSPPNQVHYLSSPIPIPKSGFQLPPPNTSSDPRMLRIPALLASSDRRRADVRQHVTSPPSPSSAPRRLEPTAALPHFPPLHPFLPSRPPRATYASPLLPITWHLSVERNARVKWNLRVDCNSNKFRASVALGCRL